MMNIFVFMSEHFEFQTKFEFEFNWNVKEHETIMIRHMFSKKINLTPGVTVASLHRGVTPCFPTRDNSPEGCAALFNAAFINFHLVECFFVDQV